MALKFKTAGIAGCFELSTPLFADYSPMYLK